MLDKIRSTLLLTSFLVIAGGLMLYVYILAKGDGDIFGAGDGTLEPTDFTTLSYSLADNGYLLCDAEECPNAESNGNAERFLVDAGRLRQIVADYADLMPTVRTHSFDFRRSQFDFLERLPGETYPTVVVVRILPDGRLNSKLVYYSYKPIGNSTADEHQERAQRWISQFHQLVNNQ